MIFFFYNFIQAYNVFCPCVQPLPLLKSFLIKLFLLPNNFCSCFHVIFVYGPLSLINVVDMSILGGYLLGLRQLTNGYTAE